MPYALSGDAWPSPQLVTISFIPDGTQLTSNASGPVYSNLFSAFNSKFGSAATWQDQILKAAQAWAQQTNINFAVVSDDGVTSGTGPDQQGDPNMGDIRIGGFNFGSTTLASAFMPPPANNYSIAGDINFNTGQAFNIGKTYDLFTVAAHEFGHALGLYHSSSSILNVMYPSYSGMKSGLSSDDTAGIRAIYSSGNARSADSYGGTNTSFAAASDITSSIDPVALTAVVNNLDISTAGKAEYFTFTAPLLTTGALKVGVQSQGLSLLAPTLTVYAADQQTVLGSASGAGQYGATISTTILGVLPGEQLYVKVAGADSSAFGTGDYALVLNFGAGTVLDPTVSTPNTTLADGNPIQGGGGQPEVASDTFNPNGDGDAPAAPAVTAVPAAAPVQTVVAVNVTPASVVPDTPVAFVLPAFGASQPLATGPVAAAPVAVAGTAPLFAAPQVLGSVPGPVLSFTATGATADAVVNEDAHDDEAGVPAPAQPDPQSPPADRDEGQPAAVRSFVPVRADEAEALRGPASCDLYFAEQARAADSPDTEPLVSPSARLAVLAVLLGGYWGGGFRPAGKEESARADERPRVRPR